MTFFSFFHPKEISLELFLLKLVPFAFPEPLLRGGFWRVQAPLFLRLNIPLNKVSAFRHLVVGLIRFFRDTLLRFGYVWVRQNRVQRRDLQVFSWYAKDQERPRPGERLIDGCSRKFSGTTRLIIPPREPFA